MENMHTVASVTRDVAAFKDALAAKQAPTPGVTSGMARRLRERNLRVMGKKSRRSAARQKFHQRQTEQSLRGMARVYFLKTGTPAMQDNVRKAVYKLADAEAGGELAKFHAALTKVEGMLRDVLQAYGDDL